MTPKDFIDSLNELSDERKQYGLIIARILGDLICALQKCNVPETVVFRMMRYFSLELNSIGV